jgi:hypothetical protein
MTGRELLSALARIPLDHLDRDVVIETGPRSRDVPLIGVAMTGPGPGILLLATEVPHR